MLFLVSAWAHAQGTPDPAQARNEQARTLIRSGQAAAALKLLEPQEDANAGNLEFDYLLG